MQIILQEDVEKLGTAASWWKSPKGYARNFLLPRKLGLEATAGNLKRLERMRAHFAKKEATEKDARTEAGRAARGVSLELTRKAGENDQLFGSVTSLDVAEALAAKGFRIDREEDRAGRADQGDGRVRGSSKAAPRSDRECEGRGEEGRVGRPRSLRGAQLQACLDLRIRRSGRLEIRDAFFVAHALFHFSDLLHSVVRLSRSRSGRKIASWRGP